MNSGHGFYPAGAARASALLAALFLAAHATGCDRDAGRVLVASGTVEATDARLGFQTPGRVAEIAVREGDAVEAGAPLAALDTSEMDAKRLQGEAALAMANARLAELSRGFRSEEIAQARAERDAAQQRLAESERALVRAERLFEGGAISREAYDQAVLGRDVASSQAERAHEQARLVETGYRTEQVDAARAQVAHAEAGLAAADAALRHMRIEAPFSGVVTLRHREPGEVVAAGAPVLTIMNPRERWVRIYVREDQIGTVHLGASADVRCDSFGDRTFPGEVTFIAAEAEFTPKNVQTPEERVKLVYAVKVSLPGDDAQDLKPGMPADVTLKLATPSQDAAP